MLLGSSMLVGKEIPSLSIYCLYSAISIRHFTQNIRKGQVLELSVIGETDDNIQVFRKSDISHIPSLVTESSCTAQDIQMESFPFSTKNASQFNFGILFLGIF